MNQSVVFEYSPFLIPVCLILGVAYALVLYFRNRKEEFNPTILWVLALVRTLVVAVISFLLLGPSIRSLKQLKEKPILLVAVDHSLSITSGADSAKYQTDWPEQLSNFMNHEESDFEVRPYVFGDKATPGVSQDYQEQYTDFSKLFDVLESNFSHRNVGALVIASDGIINRGANPLNRNINFTYPVYTIALGDTAIKKDVIINKVNYNRIAYLDNRFPVEVVLNGKKMAGLTANLRILKEGKTLHEETIQFNSNDDYRHILIHLNAEKTGTQRYTVQLSEMEGEVSLANNHLDFFIDVLDGKQKILILANSPHPDVAALEQALSGNLNFTLDIGLANDFKGKAEEYNLVILHGLPSVLHPLTGLMKEVNQLDIPVWYILSPQTDLTLFNSLETGLHIDTKNVLYNEAHIKLNPDFSLFQISKEAGELIAEFPPVYSPYADMEVVGSAESLMFQQVGSVQTDNPMLMFNQNQNRKYGILLGEGLWRWRLSDYSRRNSHRLFDDLINKVVRFLTLKVDKSLFRVYCKNNFDEGDEIEFTAEVYNESYELIHSPDISMNIKSSNGTEYPFEFAKSGNTYYLNAGNLPVDNYSYLARVKNEDKMLIESGEFTVNPVILEKINTVANHNFLFNIASNYGGRMFYPGQLKQLAEDLNGREDIKTVVYVRKQFSKLLDIPWLLGFILLFLSMEWFIRKRTGSY